MEKNSKNFVQKESYPFTFWKIIWQSSTMVRYYRSTVTAFSYYLKQLLLTWFWLRDHITCFLASATLGWMTEVLIRLINLEWRATNTRSHENLSCISKNCLVRLRKPKHDFEYIDWNCVVFWIFFFPLSLCLSLSPSNTQGVTHNSQTNKLINQAIKCVLE